MLYSWWEEGNREILAAKAIEFIKDYETQNFICAHCKEKLITKKGFVRIKNNQIEYVCSHFAHKPDSTCPNAKESDEHKSRKAILLTWLFHEKIKLNLYGMEYNIPKKFVQDMEVIRGNNRADVLIEFDSFNPMFGRGIVFEIMESETQESIEIKTKQWQSKGYSLISIKANENLTNLMDNGFELEETFTENLLEELGKQEKKLVDLIKHIEGYRMPNFQQVKITQTENSCANCKFSTIDSRISTLKACWIWRNKGLQIRPDKRDSFMICNFWEVK